MLVAFLFFSCSLSRAKRDKNEARQSQEKVHLFSVTRPLRLIIVAPHPDDETIIAGGLMLQNKKQGGENFVFYVTSGSFGKLGKIRALQKVYVAQREKEARRAQQAYGNPPSHYFFLRLDSGKGSWQERTKILHHILVTAFRKKKPDMVLTSAYEGGHCIHDWTNYVVFTAARETGYLSKVYEAPEYHPSFALEIYDPSLFFVKRWLLFFHQSKAKITTALAVSEWGAESSPTPVYQVALSPLEREKKEHILKLYTTQNFRNSLVKKFSRPEKFRLFPHRDYTQPPFAFPSSFLLKLGKKGDEIPYGVCHITFREFRKWISSE